jgi:hypothetical protein
MGSGSMICIPSVIKIGSGIQSFMGGGGGIQRYTDSTVISKEYFHFLKEESRLEISLVLSNFYYFNTYHRNSPLGKLNNIFIIP